MCASDSSRSRDELMGTCVLSFSYGKRERRRETTVGSVSVTSAKPLHLGTASGGSW